jgi:hypothetical protein
MKTLFLSLTFLISFNYHSQSTWKKNELEVIYKFGLDTNDHRGVILNTLNSNQNIDNVQKIEFFFQSNDKKDLTEINLIFDEKIKSYFYRPIDIHDLVKLYLTVKK